MAINAPNIPLYKVYCLESGSTHGNHDVDSDAADQAQQLADRFSDKTFIVYAAVAIYSNVTETVVTNANAVVDAASATVTKMDSPIAMPVVSAPAIPTPPTPQLGN